MLRNLFTAITVLVFSIGFWVQPAQASTTVDYNSSCKYFSASGNLQASTTCNINFGTLGVRGGARYIITFPNDAEVGVVVSVDGEVEANGISSEMAAGGGNIAVVTEEGEIFLFEGFESN